MRIYLQKIRNTFKFQIHAISCCSLLELGKSVDKKKVETSILTVFLIYSALLRLSLNTVEQ